MRLKYRRDGACQRDKKKNGADDADLFVVCNIIFKPERKKNVSILLRSKIQFPKYACERGNTLPAKSQGKKRGPTRKMNKTSNMFKCKKHSEEWLLRFAINDRQNDIIDPYRELDFAKKSSKPSGFYLATGYPRILLG